jgi:predicted nicotinamide N-methyase
MPPGQAAEFVRANTRLAAPPQVPELRLHLGEEPFGLWKKTEEELHVPGLPPPYWAFAWAGGQALARYLLDNTELVRGRRVFDLGSGSGLVAIAAAQTGAAEVTASDVDPLAVAAIRLNAEANGVSVAVLSEDVVDGEAIAADLVLAGDLFYEKPMALRVMRFLERAVDGGVAVLIGDPGREYLPRLRLEALATYEVPVPLGLEDRQVKRTHVWRPVSMTGDRQAPAPPVHTRYP